MAAGIVSIKPIFQMNRLGLKESSDSGTLETPVRAYIGFNRPQLPLKTGRGGKPEGSTGTSFRLEVGDAVHDHVV